MHYYSFNIGDYATSTQHLEPMEDLAYRRMLDLYYQKEAPLPDDVDQIARLIRMRSHTDCIAIVLQEFFTHTESGYRNAGADKVLNKTYDKSESARKAAQARWDKKKQEKQQVNADALQEHCNDDADGMPHKTQDPLPNTQDPLYIAPKVALCPHQEIVDLYHEILPANPVVRIWNDTRKSYLKTRWNEDKQRQNLEWWKDFFAYISKSEFLTGKIATGDRKAFIADLEWIVKPSNFVKIIEGKYE